MVSIIAVKLAELACEILVMEMKPIVLRKFSLHDLLVVDDIIGDLGIGQGQGHRIVPRVFALRGINS